MTFSAKLAGPVRRAGWAAFLVFLLLGPGRPGAPPAAAQSPADIPVEVFAQLRQISNARFSPDGKYFSMIRPYKGQSHLFVQRADGGGQPFILPPRDEFEFRWAEWANNERLLISIAFQGWRSGVPVYETRLIAANRDGSNIKYIVQQKRDRRSKERRIRSGIAQIQDNVVSYLRDDPGHILLSLDGDSDGSSELRRINVNNGKFTEIYQEFRGVQRWMADRQGKIRFGWGVDNRGVVSAGRTSRRIIRYRHADGDFVDFSKTDIYQKDFRPWDFAENPDHLFMGGTGEHGKKVVIKYDLRGEKIIETYEHGEYDAIGLRYGGVDDRPIGIRFAGGADPIIFDADWARLYRTINKALPDTYNLVVSSNEARSLHLIRATSDVDPGVYYVFNQSARRMSQLGLIYNGIDPAQMAPMKSVSYKARDGLTIPALLTLPLGSDGRNLPTVVLPHGGPHARDVIAFDYWVQFLVSRGYAVLQPNFRGSNGFGIEFLEAGYEQWGLKMQDDVTDGTRWLIAEGIADPKRICIVGGSYGGYSALMGVVKEPDLYACAVSVNGVTDIPRMMLSARKYIGGALGTRHINQEGRKEISPKFHASSITAPVLLIAAKDDRTVDYKQSRDMGRALKKAKKKYKYVEMESGDHSLTTEESRKIFLSEMEGFLAKHIGKGI